MKIIIITILSIIVLIAFYIFLVKREIYTGDSVIVIGDPTASKKPKIFWTYWEGGDIPDTVMKCIGTWTKHNPDYKTIILSRVNLHLYCDDDIFNFPYADNPPRTSDFVRLSVLEKHGGTWIDCSSILTQPLDDHPYDYVGYYINGFTTNLEYPVLENWFISCVENCDFIQKWKRAFFSINNYNTVLGYLYSMRKTTDFQNISNPFYLTMHVAAQHVLQNEKFSSSMYLMKAEDGPFKYLAENNWDSNNAVESLLRGENVTPLIKLRGTERDILIKNDFPDF